MTSKRMFVYFKKLGSNRNYSTNCFKIYSENSVEENNKWCMNKHLRDVFGK